MKKFIGFLIIAVLLICSIQSFSQSIQAGGYHSIILCSSGTVKTTGANWYGQLGDGTYNDAFTPVLVSGLTGVTAVAGGYYHTLALKDDSTVWAWGYNGYGQLGDSTYNDKLTPVKVYGLTGIIAISAGRYHSLAVKSDGTVWAWGYNGYGQLGDSTIINTIIPVKVKNLTGITSVSCGYYNSLALKNDGTVWAWGYNGYGNLGDNTTTQRLTPVQVHGLNDVGFLTGITIISSGRYHSLARKNDGTAWAWGYNGYGNFGNGTYSNSYTPINVVSLSTNVISLAAGYYHSLFVKNDGTAWACGQNWEGDLGDGTNVDKTTPVQMLGITGVSAVAGGYEHSLILKSDGTFLACGYNSDGELGDGSSTDKWTAVQIHDCCTNLPKLALANSCLAIDTTVIGGISQKTFFISNIACDTLIVSSFSNLDPSFTVTPSSINIPAYDSAFVTVSFSPSSLGSYSDTLTIFNNDNDTTICLSGYSVPAPAITVNPTSYTVNLTCGDSRTDTLLISNFGAIGSELIYSIYGNEFYDSTSFVQYFITDATTIHIFQDVPDVDSVYITVTINGDYDSGSEFADVYVEGTLIETIPDGDLLEQDITRNYAFGGSQVTTWLADGQIVVTVDNSSNVDDFGSTDYHRVTLTVQGALPNWLTANPAQGTTTQGGTDNIIINFNTTGLISGTYNSPINISSNDVLNPIISIPCTLNVIGYPEIAISTGNLDFGSIMEGATKIDSFLISNLGCSDLDISNITNSSSEFSVNTTNFIIPPFGNQYIIVTFNPQSVGNMYDTLNIINNDSNLTVSLYGNSTPAPVMSWTPDSFNVTINTCNDSVVLPLTIYNTGNFVLNYSINNQQILAPLCTPATTGWCCDMGIINVTFNTINKPSPNGAEGYKDFSTSSSTTLIPGGTYSIYVKTGVQYNEHVRAWIDYNNNGTFETNEKVLESISGYINHSANVTIPMNAVKQTPLRMRVMSEYSGYSAPQPCNNVTYGQCEDYSVIIGDFLSLSSTFGTVLSGDSSIINLTFRTENIIPGTYSNNIVFDSNDPLHLTDSIPYTLIYNGYPIISSSVNCLDFDSILQFNSKTDSLWFYNIGCDTLHITNITNSSSTFITDTTAFTILPGDSAKLFVTFNPSVVGDTYDTLRVINDDSNINICLHGYAYPPPVASFSPDSFYVVFNTCNETSTLPLTITNTGTYQLDWNLNTVTEKSLSFDGNDYISVANTGTLPTGSVMTVEAWIYPTSYTDASYNGVVSFGPRWCTGSSFLLSMTNAGRPSFASWCNDFVPSSGPTATLNAWNHIAAVLNGNNITLYLNGYSWTTTMGIVPNVQNGPCNIGCTDNTGRFFNGRIDEVRIWNTARTASEISNNQNIAINPVQNGLKAYFKFNEGNGNSVIDFTGNSHTGTINGSSYNFSSPISNIISLSSSNGTVLTGDTTIVNITFDSNNLIAGTYNQEIVFTSNDPLLSSDTISCTIIYNGYPIMAVSDSCLAFDSLIQYQSTTDTVWFANSGCDSLKITNITNSSASFSASPSTFSVFPNDSVMLIVTFSPQNSGNNLDTLHITTNDYDVDICLSGYAFYPPIISYSPDSIDVTINVCNDSVTLPLTIYNVGDTDLVYEVFENGNSGTFTAEYYYSAGTGSSPSFGTFVYSINEQYISHEWGGSGPGNGVGNDDFQVKWKGSINCETTGTYNFRSYSDDGVRLYIDGQLVINYWFDQGSTSRTGSKFLNKGNHDLEFQYYENGGGANAYLYWTPPSQAEQLIPATLIGNTSLITSINDTIISGDSAIINITFYSSELITGVYNSEIIINSNDPLSPSDTIPYTLILNGYPLISPSANCLEFDSIIQYNSKTDTLWILNSGCDSLFVTNITNLSSSFSVDTTSFAITRDDSVQVIVTFNPDIAGDVFDTLLVVNNDSNINICLHGYSYSPPIISHSPDSIVAIVNTCNDSLTVPVTIYNTGDYDLIYSINNLSILPAQCTPVTTGYCCDMGIKNVKFNTINNTTPNGSESYKNFTSTQQTRVLPGQTYNLYAQTGTQYNENVLAWIDYNNNGIFETSEKVLESLSQFINHSANVTIPTNAVENTPLRMRIMSDYYWNAVPQSCNNVQYGQCEDYSVMIGNKITLSANTDTVAQNDSSIVNVTFYTDDLLSGTYSGNISISSNDPLNPVDTIKFDLILNGYPVVSLSDSCIEMDSIIQYNSKVDSIWVYNTGCDTLKVTDINSLTAYFYADTTSFNIVPNDSMQIFVTFNPNIAGNIYDTLEIINNDSTLHVCLHGYAISPPIISYVPDSIYSIISTCSDSVTIPITVYNSGDYSLNWSFSVDAGTISDDFEPTIDNSLWSLIDGGVASANCSFNSAGNALYFDGSSRQAITRSFNTSYGGQIEFYLKLGTGGWPCENADGGEDVTLQYSIDNGNSWVNINTYLADNYPNFTLIQENIPIAAKTNNTFFKWIQFSHSGSGYDNWAIDDVAFNNITNNITLDSVSGTIATGDSAIINATFLTDGLVTGIYNNLLIINSNDPLSPVDTIVATIEYNGYPIISLSDTCLVFDTIIQWDNDIQSFYVYNTGCDTLFISNITSDLPEFTTTDTLFTLLPSDSALVSVNFAAVTVGNFNGTLSIVSNTTTKTLCLTGVSIVPPQISFSPSTLTANITACNDTFTTPLTIYNSGDYQLIYSIGSPVIQSPLCTPATTAYCCGMGITRFVLNTIDYVTSDGSDGYKDYTFMQTQLMPSQTYPVTVRTGNTYTENVRIWIDFNNDGTFDVSEIAFESLNQLQNHNGNITIPSNSVLQTPLRLRVGSDLGTNAIPQPCTTVEYGQFEDYTVIIGSGISFTNSSDTIPSGDSSIVNVNLDATVATSGTYNYSIIINSNDPISPVVEVPFNFVIDPLPSQPVVTDEAICFGAATPDLVAIGTNVDWFSDAALTNKIDSGNTHTTGETAVGQYTYYVTQTINSCQGPSDTVTLSINPVYNLTDSTAICNGDSLIFGTQTLISTGVYIETFSTVNGCDSVVTLTLTVNPTYSEVDATSICNGDSYIFGTQTLTTSGTYVETFQTVNGCDSIVTLSFTVYPTYNETDSTSITCGGSYTFGTQTLTTAGIYVETFNTINSCDSIVTLTLFMIPTYTVNDTATICDGDIFSFGTQNLTIAGTYNETFTALDGCDSLVTLELYVNPVFATTDSASITCGQVYTFGTQSLTLAGVYNETFSSVLGCDSVVTLTLFMIPSYTTNDSVAICDGDSYIFGTQTLSANGVYNETFTADDGCDSLVTLTLYIKPTFSSLDAATICNGDSYTLGTQTLTVAGAYVETFTAINGCDSVVYFSLSVNPTYNLTDSSAICNGDSFIFGTQTLTSAGFYVETFSSINGCDSVVTLTLTINPVFAELDTATICNGDVFVFGTQNLTIAGNYAETFSSVYGCDSVVTLTLNVNPTFAEIDSATICNGDSFTFGTQTLTIAGVYNETFIAINGCDSVVTLTLNVNPIYSEVDSNSITCGDSLVFGTQTLTVAGIYNETFASINGCDSVVTLTLSMIPSYTTLDSATICNGDTFMLGTQSLTIAGVYNETFTAIDGCDSLVTFTLNVNPTYNLTDNASICDGDSYTFGTQTLTTTGVYNETFTTINGCDSVVTLTFTVNSTYNVTDSTAICNGNSFIFGTQTLTGAGVYNETFSSINGCDSIVTLTLTVNPVYSETDSATICDGDVYNFGTQSLTTSGVYNETFSSIYGCDSVVSLTLFVNPVYAELDTASIVCGASYTFGTQTLTVAGNYSETFSSVNSCDSVVTLTLLMIPSYITDDSTNICDGDTLIFGSQTLTIAGIYNETFTALDGCDSLVNLTLNVNPVYAVTDSVSITCGASYVFGTQTLSIAGVYTETFNSISSCDSVVTLTLYVIPEFTETDSATICDGDSIIFGTQILKIVGTYTELFSAVDGCDSLVTLTLFVNPISTSSDAVSICDGDSYTFGTQTLTVGGVYNETFTSTINGCDSVVTLTLTINYSNTGTDVQTACDSYDWIDGNTYTASTSTPTFTLTNVAGCDSVVTLNLTINNSNTGIDIQTACDSYTWLDGNTYTASNNAATFTLSNVAGCDSVVTLNLTINNSNTGTDVQTACDSYTWIDGNNYISSTNTPTFTLSNVAGCDSVVTLNLTINNSNSGTDVQIGCNSYTWIDGNTYISSTNTPTFTLSNVAGCDSVVTLNLTINNSNTSTDIQTACDSYTWIDGNTYTSSNNTATFTLTNAAGCDSVITLNLTLNNSTSSTDIQTACDSYLWIDGITYTSSTNTPTFTMTNTADCDSVITLSLTVNPVYSDSIEASITCGGSYIFNADTLTTAGTYYDSLMSVNSCDSVIVLTLSMIPAYTVFDTATTCEGTPYYFGTQTLTIAGVYNETFIAITNGCDSLVILTLTVNPTYSDTISATINCGDSLLFVGQYLTNGGFYYDSLFTTLSCDSVIVLNLIEIPEFSISYPAEICDGDIYVFGTQTLTIAGTYYETFAAVDSCDSLVTLNLSVRPVYSVTDSASICDGDSYNFGTQTLTTSGVYYDTSSTVFGCDSVIILNFTVKPNSYLTIDDSISCGQTYDFYGTTLDSANTYTHTLVAANGCDSIITLNLSMIPSFVTTDSGIICDGDEFVFGTQTLTIAGVYNETFTATNGCDSLVLFTLSVKPTPQTALLDTISCGQTYDFNGTILDSANTYYSTLIAANGCDSIVTLYLAMRPSFTTPLTATICDGDEYLFGTDTLTVQGVYNHTLTAINGCDSLVTLTLTVTPLPATPIVADISKCTGSVFPTFTASGNVINWYADSLFVTLLNTGNSYTPADSTAGTYNYYVTQTANGCTSLYEIATLQIYQTPAAPISSNSGVCFGNANPILFASGTNICWYSNMLLTDTLTLGNAYQPTETAIDSYYYYVTQRSDYCGVSQYTIVSFEITNPSAAPQANDVAVCFGESVPDLTVLAPNNNIEWYSEPELVILVNTGSNFTTGNADVGQTTYYIVQNNNGCISSTGNVTLTINPKPLVTLDRYYVNIEKGDSVTITANNADSYTWTPIEGLNVSVGSQVIAKPDSSTTYIVFGTNINGCIDSASCFIEVGKVGVDETSFEQSVSVYPNPADNQITVSYKSYSRVQIKIRIYNALNQIIYSKDAVAESGELIEVIKLENLPDAIYNLQIIRDGGVVNKKIVIKH